MAGVALGGGGGNLGVAAFSITLRPIGEVTFHQLKWPFEATAKVLDYWQQWGPDADQRLTCQLTCHAKASGKGVTSEGLFLGSTATLRTMLEPWTEVAEPTYFRIEKTTYRQSLAHAPRAPASTWLTASSNLRCTTAPTCPGCRPSSPHVTRRTCSGSSSRFRC